MTSQEIADGRVLIAHFMGLKRGNYEQGCIGEDYLTKAEMVLKDIIKN